MKNKVIILLWIVYTCLPANLHANEKDTAQPNPARYTASDSIYDLSVNSGNEYVIFSYKHKTEVFEWQLYSSKIIFCLVLLIVITGLAFSGWATGCMTGCPSWA